MKNVNEKIKIGTAELNGRIVMPPMGTYKCSDNGIVSDEVIDYYSQRAKNPNISLIITEHSYIMPSGRARVRQMSVANDECIDGLSRLVSAIHANGTLAFAQLNHAGSATTSEVIGSAPVAPSPIVLPVTPQLGTETPIELSKEQIQQIIQAFADSAVRAKKAGYDGVEIHSAHGYLLNQFYSPLTNRRTDEYGGELENRLKIHKEVIRAVRKAVGSDYPISVRLGGCDYTDGGSSIEDSVNAAKILENENIQLINVTGGMNRYTIKGHTEPGYFGEMSKAIRQNVSVPVMVAGGVKAVDEAEALLDDGIADIIGVGRALMKDSNWGM